MTKRQNAIVLKNDQGIFCTILVPSDVTDNDEAWHTMQAGLACLGMRAVNYVGHSVSTLADVVRTAQKLKAREQELLEEEELRAVEEDVASRQEH